MAKTAPLSYTSQFGYYGLRVNPTFDQVARTVKPLRLPIPDRSAIEYAMSLERGYILDQAKAGSQQDRALLNYRDSQASLPETAARDSMPSRVSEESILEGISQGTAAIDQQKALELAKEAQNAEHRRQTAEMRAQQLAATHGAWSMHPTVEAAHEELEEAGVPHEMPVPRLAPVAKAWPAPAEQWAAYGQRQAPEFTSFEILNMGQPATLKASKVTRKEGLTYEHLRDLVVEPTWSS